MNFWNNGKLWHAVFTIWIEAALLSLGLGLIGTFYGDPTMFGAGAGYAACRIAHALRQVWPAPRQAKFYLLATWLMTFGGGYEWYRAKELARDRMGEDQFVTQSDQPIVRE